MKRNLLIAIMAIGLISCSKSENGNKQFENIPAEVRSLFDTRFPTAKKIEWEYKASLLQAEFVMDKADHDAWFENTGTWKWIRTEKDVKPANLPQAITNYVNSNYPGWRIDDADFIQTPDNEYFELEIEKRGEFDVTLFIKQDGTLLFSFVDIDGNDKVIAETYVPQAVKTEFINKYPKATRIRWEKEGNLYEAEFILENKKHESLFRENGTWVRTEIDLHPKSTLLPLPVQNYITTNFAGWRIDDIDLIQVPGDEYYEIEMEKNGQPDTTIFIREDGSLAI